ncbi:MAG: sensor histidine kinase FleS [Congregibacter sp.]
MSIAQSTAEVVAEPEAALPPADSLASERAETLESLAEVSRELDLSYRDLESQVLRLRAELALSRSARLKELREKERLLGRLSSLLSVLPGGVVLLDSNAAVRDANPTALNMLGEPLLGESWEQIKQRNPELNGASGGERRLSVSSRALEGHDEEVVLITDTTDMHAMEQQQGRQHRLAALGEMAARLAHQIRTPLASTTLYLAQLERGELAQEQREKIVDRLSDRLAHMDGLIESMLSFVRGRSPAMAPISLSDVFATLELTLRADIPEDVRLTITPLDHTLGLCGAADELVAALSNLVRNAIELPRRPLSINIWAGATSPDTLQIRVSDDGPGISADVLPRLFDPFFTTRSGGTGLGLAVVAMTASNHGGQVRAQNRREGGAEFLIDLPLLAANRSFQNTDEQTDTMP